MVKRTKAQRSASAKKAVRTRKRNAAAKKKVLKVKRNVRIYFPFLFKFTFDTNC